MQVHVGLPDGSIRWSSEIFFAGSEKERQGISSRDCAQLRWKVFDLVALHMKQDPEAWLIGY